MLYICIPAHNEASTVGVLLWRIRKVFQEYSREYEIVVYDDGSTDATAETLAPYRKVLPLTIIGGKTQVGYAGAVDALCRFVARRTRYPRRDAMVLMQADFTDQPEHLPELVKRFEGGADIVVAERPATPSGAIPAPVPVQRLRLVAPWVLRPFVAVPGVRDPFGVYRLYRISVLRDMLKAAGDTPLPLGEGWTANVGLLLEATPYARRVEAVELAPRYDVRARESRVKPWADVMSLYRYGRVARARRRPLAEAAAARVAEKPAREGREGREGRGGRGSTAGAAPAAADGAAARAAPVTAIAASPAGPPTSNGSTQ